MTRQEHYYQHMEDITRVFSGDKKGQGKCDYSALVSESGRWIYAILCTPNFNRGGTLNDQRVLYPYKWNNKLWCWVLDEPRATARGIHSREWK